ncbi:uncharacterized protein LOC111611033 isoform X2 [Xiphophorus maculatus]|uniref:uncharacterized protein LOC111611033 isoform X2 n=1 Tax=Xiphophorus maculatus TaxID=8083 RepID=UPI000C6DC326|nr:uncharacterized protein LOC111611033 isoform X2 [Xiphophorus maculatus]
MAIIHLNVRGLPPLAQTVTAPPFSSSADLCRSAKRRMNLYFGRRDRLNQEMASSLPASLFLLSVVFCQFVSAADQNIVKITATVGDDVILPCKDPDQKEIIVVEWSRTDLGSGFVLLYRNLKFDLENQLPSYTDRVDLLVGQIKKGDASLVLKNTTTDDSGTYECYVVKTTEKKLISSVSLVVTEPFPVWATVLLVLLVLLGLALVAAAIYYLFFWRPDQQVEVEPRVESVLLPFKVPRCLWFCKYRIFQRVAKVEWKDEYNRTVHVYQNGSDQPGVQNLIYRTRTKMDENLLKTGDLSLTLSRPRDEDRGTFTCSLYNRKGEKLMMKDVWLKVRVLQVEVESGVESVLLPCRTRENLDGDVKVEWKDKDYRTVHVYENGSDQPEEQDEFYRTRTKMDENLLKNKDLSLTLNRPTGRDSNIYTCRVCRDGDMLMKKEINLQVKVLEWVEVESGEESVELPWRTTEDLDGDVKVEWKDKENRTVHVYQNGSDQLGEQDKFYRTRTKMDENQLKTKDLSLTLKWPSRRDGGIYTCSLYNRKGDVLMMKDVWLKVKVLQVEVEPGEESVLLPCRTRENLDGDVKVEWKDKDDRTVHVYENGSDQPEEQDEFYRTRTKMDENLLKNKDLSLTLNRPTRRDGGIYTCCVYNRDGDVLMMKQINLCIIVQQVVVDPGEESVLLPCRTRENLDGDVKVEWRDKDNRTVHVYQNGSDQAGEQDKFYRTRTKMDENLLENKNLSLTLRRPLQRDDGIFFCRVYNRDGDILMVRRIWLDVEVQQVEVEPGAESVLLPCRTRENLDGDVKVEWKDDYDIVVHVYENGSDQPGEQYQLNRTRTKMDENLLKNKDLSLTLIQPTERDGGRYTCRVYRDGDMLMKKFVWLWFKGTDRVQPEDTKTRSNSIDQPLMADQLV